MKRMVRTTSWVLVALVALTFVLAPLPAAAKKPDVVVNGGGQGILTDDSGWITPPGAQYPIQFAIAGVVAGDGSASGHINFNFHGEFARVWGSEPGTDMFRIEGQVTEGYVEEDGTIVLEGWLTETDFRHGDGAYVRIDDPFVIKLGGDTYGTDSFLLQWCLLPEWLVDVPGGMHIH